MTDDRIRVRRETEVDFRANASIDLAFQPGAFVFEGEKEIGYSHKKTTRATKFELTHAKITSSFSPPYPWAVRNGATAPGWSHSIKLFGVRIRKDGSRGEENVEVSGYALDGHHSSTRNPASEAALAVEKLARDLLAEYGRRADVRFSGGERLVTWSVGDRARVELGTQSADVTIENLDLRLEIALVSLASGRDVAVPIESLRPIPTP